MSATGVRSLGFSGLIAAALVMSLMLVSQRDTTPADAADAQTAALIGYFNQYRASIGVPTLATSSSMNSATQQSANNSMAACTHPDLPSGSGTKWGGYGFTSAAQMWSIYQQDSQMLGIIGRASFRSAGVGRATADGCNLSPYWVMWLSSAGGDGPAPTVPPSATQPPTASPTQPPASPTQPPTASPTKSPTPTPSPSPTPTRSPTPTPSPTPVPIAKGDTDCDGVIGDWDLLNVLLLAAGMEADADCIGVGGFDCSGEIDVGDILALVQYLGGIPRNLPPGCADLGSAPTPAPTTTPVVTPALTPTPTPVVTHAPTATPGASTATPSETPAPTPTAGGPATGIQHCFLAPIAYEITNWLVLDGVVECAPEGGVSYSCNFMSPGNQAVCESGSPEVAPSYDCYVWSTVPHFGLCESLAGTPDYNCYSGEGSVECLPVHAGAPIYHCAVTGEVVACTTTASGHPDFECVREGAAFVCALP